MFRYDHNSIFFKSQVYNILHRFDLDISILICTTLASRMDIIHPEKQQEILDILEETREYINQYH